MEWTRLIRPNVVIGMIVIAVISGLAVWILPAGDAKVVVASAITATGGVLTDLLRADGGQSNKGE